MRGLQEAHHALHLHVSAPKHFVTRKWARLRCPPACSAIPTTSRSPSVRSFAGGVSGSSSALRSRLNTRQAVTTSNASHFTGASTSCCRRSSMPVPVLSTRTCSSIPGRASSRPRCLSRDPSRSSDATKLSTSNGRQPRFQHVRQSTGRRRTPRRGGRGCAFGSSSRNWTTSRRMALRAEAALGFPRGLRQPYCWHGPRPRAARDSFPRAGPAAATAPPPASRGGARSASLPFYIRRGVKRLPSTYDDRRFLLQAGAAGTLVMAVLSCFDVTLGDSEVLAAFLAVTAIAYGGLAEFPLGPKQEPALSMVGRDGWFTNKQGGRNHRH